MKLPTRNKPNNDLRVKRRSATLLALAMILSACSGSSENKTSSESEGLQTDQVLPYQDTSLPMSQRVSDLVKRMSLEEKVAQMYNDAPAIERLDVPAYDYWNEALHGVARAGEATVFPQAIGMAAMWDRALLNEIATVISDEGRAKHHAFKQRGLSYRYTGLTYWSPNINIFRDPRWGRGQETYGEDPYLTGELGVAFINGLQGDDETYLKTAATAKHFAVHNGPEVSRHSDDYVVSDKDLFETYLPAFEKAVVEADVEAVMCAYNRVNGAPACGSDRLLKDILRGDYQFDGHVMSDCGAIADFYDPKAHNVTRSPAAAAAWAVKSGTDLNCGTGRLSSYANLTFAVQKGFIEESLIDQAVGRLMMTRFKLGMFDPDSSVPFADIPLEVVGAEEHLALTQKASERALVLLKNNGVLPLQQGVKVAVIGPNADNQDVLLGNYNGLPVNPVTVLQGIKNYTGNEAVPYAPGSALIDDIYGHWQVLDESVLFHRDESGELSPGVKVEYYAVAREPITDFSSLRVPAEQTGSAVNSEILNTLQMRSLRSPVSGKWLDDFAMVAHGQLVPQTSGSYRFDGPGEVMLNGELVNGAVALNAEQSYDFKVSHRVVSNPVSNTAGGLRAEWQLRWVNESKALQEEALAKAAKADVVVMAVGISPRIEGEEMPVKLDGFNYGDRTSIALPEEQQQLIKAVEKLGKPVVLVNFSGSAMALNWEQDNVDAIIQAFYPGEATGTALARILWGEVNPSGRLPVTFYKNLDGFAPLDDYAMANRTYRYFEGDVLYPFGFGLGYSTIQYSGLQAPDSLASGEDLTLSVTLNNSGEQAASQVTQVYVSMPDAPVDTPRLSLKGFTRSTIDAGAQQTVSLTVTADELVYIDEQGQKVPYTGALEVYMGDGQPGYGKPEAVAHKRIQLQ
ncbi:glycoside hydrolase family 3 C-terminal domain-containing protein [uncultured Alteromonas sp.]|jgi:beta-glucosidase|uniref:glycoside hydrolase family 3 C-terminal domain-containing protein n=1 Tax=uncultured Alteromonas sp. TaxID=179113 RepID=UPI0025ED367C|nr:glycoside hydrolase family 3 C-terminal domain-containing protein [uncultured Alteromonas sp.]